MAKLLLEPTLRLASSSACSTNTELKLRFKASGDFVVSRRREAGAPQSGAFSSYSRTRTTSGGGSLRILISGGGIGGLVLALAAKRRGYEVMVFEKDLSAVRGEGRHRGPIQLLSSALGLLQAIDHDVAQQVFQASCVTGDRINGLADGLSGHWFTKFDLFTPAVKRGLPVTRVICRMALQDILLDAVGPDIVFNNSKVVDFTQNSGKVTVVLDDGQEYQGNVLVGADGIWSRVRSKLFGPDHANYSGYTCYSGLANFSPAYIDTIGYRVFLGLNQYFVASDVGHGKMQWYAFHKEPPMTSSSSKGNDVFYKKKRLLGLFANWCKEVTELITETPDNMILQRDIYDRDMIYTWGIGQVTLLGDAAHPMQPNLGQGGCMAIEDCYQLILELDKCAASSSADIQQSGEIVAALRRYERKRIFRITAVHTASRMASKVLTAYQPYMEFRCAPLSYLSSLRIIKPSVHLARFFLQFFLPQFMTWMMCGGRRGGLLLPNQAILIESSLVLTRVQDANIHPKLTVHKAKIYFDCIRNIHAQELLVLRIRCLLIW